MDGVRRREVSTIMGGRANKDILNAIKSIEVILLPEITREWNKGREEWKSRAFEVRYIRKKTRSVK